jgi:N-acetylglutamate synthase-like GNAT family acetyltransferase
MLTSLSSRAMSTPQLQVRRATIDDLPKLAPLWRAENLPVEDLEKRFKEFQVAESQGGEVFGAIGLQIAGHEARVHSEVFTHPEHADALREKLWERVKVLANNHGLVRVWTQLAVPFWHQNGFAAVPAEALGKLPPAFLGDSRPWLLVQLRPEPSSAISLDKEFAMFREAERERTERMFRQARVLKMIAAAFAVAVLFLVLFWAISFFRLQNKMRR